MNNDNESAGCCVRHRVILPESERERERESKTKTKRICIFLCKC